MVRKRRPYGWKGDRFTEAAYKSHVKAIGQLALAWNDLHERLGEIFVVVMEGNTAEDNEDNLFQIAAVWSAANSDRTKREMLEAAVKFAPKLEGGPFPRLADDIKWLIGRSTALEDTRNDVIHAPLVSLHTTVRTAFDLPAVMPNLLLQNSRAGKLARKNSSIELSVDFRWCRDSILLLRDYAISLRLGLTVEGRTWPERPRLPNRGQKKNPPSRTRQPYPK
jgi:hypothetical protein